MANKFQRNYLLTVMPNNGGPAITIAPPFTIEMDITRTVLNSLNSAKISIYNLSARNRNLIVEDFYQDVRTRTVILQAGYGPTKGLPTIFYGSIFRAFSRRDGVNFITEITGVGGLFAPPKGYYTGTFPIGATEREVIVQLAQSLADQNTGLSVGFIGDFPNVLKTTRSYSQPIMEALLEITGDCVFIDNNKINCLPNGKAIPTPNPILINSAMGLLGTPEREEHNMTVPILFTPEIKPGELINLKSLTLETSTSSNAAISSSFNGLQKVNSVHHMGMISDVVCGELITELGVIWGIAAVGT